MMRLPDLLVPSTEPPAVEAGAVLRRRRITAGATLVTGAGLLAATLHTPRGSGWFTALGLLVAATWITGALLSGPIPIRPRSSGPGPRAVALAAGAIGVVAFAAFVGASLVARHLPVVSGAVDNVLSKADAGPRAVILVVALVNAVAEELFFRGALHAALEPRWPAVGATAAYVAVTATAGNVALVLAAVVMGTIFSLERLSSRSVLAPAITHVTWSTLMLLAFPR